MTDRVYWITSLLIIMASSCLGQEVLNQTNLYIPAGLEVHVDGGVSNSGFLQNQGNILLTGNWANSNVYQGLGTITLQGRQSQKFSNNDNAVFNMVVAGGGRKQFAGNTLIVTSLVLEEGIVDVVAPGKLTLEDGLNLKGGSSSSFINGALAHNGSGYKFFPIGKVNTYYPIELLEINGGKVSTELEAFTDVSTLSRPLNYSFYSGAYWKRTTTAGTFISSPVSIGYSIPDGYTDNHTLDILESAGSGAPFEPLGKAAVNFQPGIDKISSPNAATGTLLVIGESTTFYPNPNVGSFYLSTSMSPSAADVRNRAIRVFGDELQADGFQLIVYNRWGLKVFETRSLQEMSDRGWDGVQERGREPLPSGAYPFILNAKNLEGELVEKKGTINIIR